MKTPLQNCIHNALISLFNNDLFDAEEKAELSASILDSQGALDKMIADGDLTPASVEAIDTDIGRFMELTGGRSTENKVMACSILMLLLGVDIAAEMKQVAKQAKEPTSDAPQDVAPATAEQPQPEGEGTIAKLVKSREKYGDEQVLVVTRAWLVNVFGASAMEAEFNLFQGYTTAGRNTLDAILEEAHFMPRHLMEEDVTCKQLIPYLVVVDENNQVLTYLRGKAGMEDRLHAKLSFGFGGHINPVDGATLDDPINRPGKLFNPSLTVESCVLRELKEEIGLKLTEGDMKPKLVGFVNNDADAVGKVHLGLVYIVAVNNSQVDMTKAEASVVEPRWRNAAGLTAAGINHQRLEEWSRLIADPLFGTRSRHLDRAIDDGPLPADNDFDEPLPPRTCGDGEACESCQ